MSLDPFAPSAEEPDGGPSLRRTLGPFNLIALGIGAGIVVLRRTRPDLERPYRTPFVPVVPALGILVCRAMMYSLDVESWYRLFGWLAIGLSIYFSYGRRSARGRTLVTAGPSS